MLNNFEQFNEFSNIIFFPTPVTISDPTKCPAASSAMMFIEKTAVTQDDSHITEKTSTDRDSVVDQKLNFLRNGRTSKSSSVLQPDDVKDAAESETQSQTEPVKIVQ